jgi:hypothetical protein
MKITPWNFSSSRRTTLSLDEFLAEKDAAGFRFFDGQEPWLNGINKITWQTFFRVCTQEMDDLSRQAVKLVIEYCLEILEEVEGKLKGKASLARLEGALDAQYAAQYETGCSNTDGRSATPSSEKLSKGLWVIAFLRADVPLALLAVLVVFRWLQNIFQRDTVIIQLL